MTAADRHRLAACQTDPRWAAEVYGFVLVPRDISDGALEAGMSALGDMAFFGHQREAFRRMWAAAVDAIMEGK